MIVVDDVAGTLAAFRRRAARSRIALRRRRAAGLRRCALRDANLGPFGLYWYARITLVRSIDDCPGLRSRVRGVLAR